jgi:hypothetical protein
MEYSNGISIGASCVSLELRSGSHARLNRSDDRSESLQEASSCGVAYLQSCWLSVAELLGCAERGESATATADTAWPSHVVVMLDIADRSIF